jgi:hypothetical protein
MNRINPLYILAGALLVLVVSSFMLLGAQKELLNSNASVVALTKQALAYSQIKKSNTKNRFTRLLKDAKFASFITKKGNLKNMEIVFKNSNRRTVEQFLNKLLNMNVHITSMTLNKERLMLKVSVL